MGRPSRSDVGAECIEFGGVNFWRYPESPRRSDRTYYRGWWRGIKTYLHVVIYEHINGPIPMGYELKFKGSPDNLQPDNLEALPVSKHRKQYAPATGRSGRKGAEFRMECKHCHAAIIAKSHKRQFCNANCQYHAAQESK